MATETDSVRTDAIGTVMAVLALAVIVTGLAVTALVRTEEQSLAASRETTANLRPLRELRASQLSELNAAPNWVNRDQSTISIPIARAMELVVQEERIASKLAPKVDALEVAKDAPSGISAVGAKTPSEGQAAPATSAIPKEQSVKAVTSTSPSTTSAPPAPAATNPSGAPQPTTAGALPANSVSP